MPTRRSRRLSRSLLFSLLACAAALLVPVARAATDSPTPSRPRPAAPAGLEARLAAIAARSNGQVGIAVTHVESGQSLAINADQPLAAFSVMKLPVAVAVLAEVEAGRLALTKTLHITRADVTPGGHGNTQRWADVPQDLSVQQLLDLSLVFSDNTSSDKLMGLLGGPAGVMRKLTALKLDGLDVRGTYHTKDPAKVNRASAAGIARLLTRLSAGQLLARPQRDLLLDFLTRSPTGARRLRGQLPPGTRVADKTGTGGDAGGTNDVGIIDLPAGKGHLAAAVLINGAKKLTTAQQEDLIAEIARTCYDAFTADAPASAPGKP
jgi:beta-lactamase class A